MKLSYKFMITILAIAAPCTMLSKYHFAANQEGRLYDELPINIKNSGKKVTLKMSKCPTPSTVEIMYLYKIAGTTESHGGVMQTLQFDSSKTSQLIHILPPIDIHNAEILVNVMPKPVWDLHIKAALAQENTHPTPAQKTETLKLTDQLIHQPTNTLKLEYADIQENQTINLPFADASTPKVNDITQNWVNEEFGITYEKLKPFLDKQPGKTIFLKVSPQITETMTISITSTVKKPNGNSASVTQIIMITPDTDKVLVKIPEPPSTSPVYAQEIRFSIEFEKIFRELKKISLPVRKLSADEKAQKDTLSLLTLGLQNSFTHPYATLSNQQTIVLPNPSKKLALVKKLIGC